MADFSPMYGISPSTGKQQAINTDSNGNLQIFTTAGSSIAINDSATQTNHWKILASGAGIVSPVGAYPNTATPLTADSGNQANTVATATLAGASGVTTYISGFIITASGSTAATVVTVTITGVISGTLHLTFVSPAGATTAATPLVVTFPYPIPASAQNTAIAVSLPALGAGNTNATVNAFGFQL